ncbi:hypothetical protein [Sphingobacterium corticibacter]|nr:hypothetical protein [Sphingobacterium corticibacter]
MLKKLKVKNLVGPHAPRMGLLQWFSEGLLIFWEVGDRTAED